MPIYEYTCEKCNHNFEEISSLNSKSKVKCEKCKKNTAKKTVSQKTTFKLKGGCWEKDGYEKPSNNF